MKYFFIGLLLVSFTGSAQELYVYSEPASNMPAKSVSTKVSTMLGSRPGGVMQRYTPEVMLGLNKKWMVHVATTFSNMHADKVGWESAYLYAKYRFLSQDEVHAHFRMAAFAEGGYSKNKLVFDELNFTGDMSGIQGGLIATQLVNKFAVSGTVSFMKSLYDKSSPLYNHSNHNLVDAAMNYTLSAGYLVLPFEYKSYDQLNFNIYTEILAQQALDKDVYFIDVAPAIQFIFNSNSKLNLGYRFQAKGNASRNMLSSYLLSFEHTFFNVLRKKK